MVVKLYQFSKRINSTKIPGDTVPPTELAGNMIDGGDMLHPRVSFRFGGTGFNGKPQNFNYAHIPELSSRRYYYINNWTFYNGVWIADMSVDVLASYRGNIGNSQQYILRSASKHNGLLSDGMYPATSFVTTTVSNMNLHPGSPWSVGGNAKNGYFVVGVINNDSTAVGSVSYYSFTHAQIKKFLEVLFGDGVNWLNICDISEELTQALYNPFQYVVSCMWFPVEPVCNGTVSALPYGWWTLPGVSAGKISETTYNAVVADFTIPHHPQYNDNDLLYLDADPFTNCTAIVEPWGSFNVPADCYRGSISMRITADFATGRGVLSLETPTGAAIVYRDGVFGVPVQLSQLAVNPVDAIGSFASTVGGAVKSVASGDLVGSVVGVASGVLSTIEAGLPSLETKGLTGCFMSFDTMPKIVTRCREVVNMDAERFGRPYLKPDTISNHSGFVLCSNPSVVILNAFPAEIEAVNRFLSEGFYYE